MFDYTVSNSELYSSIFLNFEMFGELCCSKSFDCITKEFVNFSISKFHIHLTCVHVHSNNLRIQKCVFPLLCNLGIWHFLPQYNYPIFKMFVSYDYNKNVCNVVGLSVYMNVTGRPIGLIFVKCYAYFNHLSGPPGLTQYCFPPQRVTNP